MVNHTTIDALFYKLDLHDLPTEKMEIDFELRTLVVNVSEWSDVENKYCSLILKFKGLRQFSTNYPPGGDFESVELYSVDIASSDEKYHKAEMVFLMGISQPSWQVELTFESLEIDRTLGVS